MLSLKRNRRVLIRQSNINDSLTDMIIISGVCHKSMSNPSNSFTDGLGFDSLVELTIDLVDILNVVPVSVFVFLLFDEFE